jgi:flagellar hook assembly protein FlgD
LTIYSISGQKIKTLVHNRQESGNYKVDWDAANDNNIPVGSGIYICKLEFDGYILAKKMLYLK